MIALWPRRLRHKRDSAGLNGHSVDMARAAAVLALVTAVVFAGARPARASCVAMSDAEQRARASVIFEGVALRGDTANGALLSPAHFQVARYLKGSGADVVKVPTGLSASGTLVRATSTGITVRPGERWRIYGQRSPDAMVKTSVCAGSERLGRTNEPVAAAPASDVGTDLGAPWPLIALAAALLGTVVGVVIRRSRMGRRASSIVSSSAS